MSAFESTQTRIEFALTKLQEFRDSQGLLRKLQHNACEVDFSGNDFLGLAEHRFCIEAKLGTGSSRLIQDAHQGINELEEYCTKWLQWQAGLFLPNAFMGNLAIADALATIPGVHVFLDHRAHASMHAGAKWAALPITLFRHGDMNHLKNALVKSQAIIKIIWIESLHSMDGTFEDANTLQEIARVTGAVFVVDEAHSVGTLSPVGWIDAFPEFKKNVLVALYGFGKSVGAAGCFVGCSKVFYNQLVQYARPLIYSTAPCPAQVAAAAQAVQRVRDAHTERNKLQKNIVFFRRQLRDSNWNISDKYKENCFQSGECILGFSPVFSLGLGCAARAMNWSQSLLKNGIFAPAIRTPTVPQRQARLRINVTSKQSEKNIMDLISYLEVLRRES